MQASAELAVAAHESRIGAQIALNRMVAGNWRLYSDNSEVTGFIAFSATGKAASDLDMRNGDDDVFASKASIRENFTDLDVKDLT